MKGRATWPAGSSPPCRLMALTLILIFAIAADSLLFGKGFEMSRPCPSVLRRCSARLLAQDLRLPTVCCSSSKNPTQHEEEQPFAFISPAVPVVLPSSAKRIRLASHNTSPAAKKQRETTDFASPESKPLLVLSRAVVVTPSSSEDVPSARAAVSGVPKTGNSMDCKGNCCFRSDDEFQDLGVPPAELRPSATLTTGQCFHWKVVVHVEEDEVSSSDEKKQKKISAWGSHDATEWIGSLRVPLTGETVVVVIRETLDTVLYRTLYAPSSLDVRSFLYSYFQLPTAKDSLDDSENASLQDMYREWSTQCDRLRRIALCLPGVRIIDQDPWECLVSFLCSSNNNIPRIHKMLAAIRRHYGEPLLTITASCLGEGKRIAGAEDGDGDSMLYSFPSLEQLQRQATEADLRAHCGMGYRAKYLIETMKTLTDLGGETYLQELRGIKDPVVVQEKLIQFCGVGMKVADCVALFSLQQSDAIPVDVHVWNIARRDYGANAIIQTTKSLTPTIYKQIGDLFRSRFSSRSGWAHSLLFVAELPSFRQALPDDLVEEMDQFRAEEKAKKEARREQSKSRK